MIQALGGAEVPYSTTEDLAVAGVRAGPPNSSARGCELSRAWACRYFYGRLQLLTTAARRRTGGAGLWHWGGGRGSLVLRAWTLWFVWTATISRGNAMK